MRKVCRLGREVLDIAAAHAKPGVTTDYIDEIVHKACLERNVSILLYERFDFTDHLSHILHLSIIVISQSQSAHPLTRSFAMVFRIGDF